MHGLSVVALGFLADANEAAPRAAAGTDAEALHDFRVAVRRLRSWVRAFDDELDGAVKKKQRRRLKRIARATNPGRDLHVQLEWLEAAKKTGGERRRAGAAWMAKYLSATAPAVQGGLRTAIERDFVRVFDALGDSLSGFDRDSDASLPAAIAERIEPYLLAVTTLLDRLHSIGDERASHKARIRVKRLRYLIEPLADTVEDADRLVERLKTLQDALGRVHDDHVLSHAMREALEGAAVVEARRAGAAALGKDLVIEVEDPATRLLGRLPRAGVLSLMRHLRDDLDDAFAASRAVWDAARDEIEMLAARLAVRPE